MTTARDAKLRPGNGVRRLALGTAQFGFLYGIANTIGQVPLAEGLRMLDFAADAGLDTIDTAIGYGDSESRLGEGGARRFRIVTKLPGVPAAGIDVADWTRRQIEASLLRLGIDRLYGLLLHHPLNLLRADGRQIFDALQAAKARGQVEKIGVSVYNPEELAALSTDYRLDIVQAPFNLLNRRLATSGWMRRLKDDGVEIHTRSAFHQGLLLMARQAIPAKFAPWTPLWDRWHQWLAEHGRPASTVCLAFPLSFPEIDRVVVGAESLRQLQEITTAAGETPPSELPDLACEAEELINPAKWESL